MLLLLLLLCSSSLLGLLLAWSISKQAVPLPISCHPLTDGGYDAAASAAPAAGASGDTAAAPAAGEDEAGAAPTAAARRDSDECPAAVDAAAARLLERLLTERLLPAWNQRVSADPGLAHELRQLIAAAARQLLMRARRLRPAQLLLERLLPAAAGHVDCCLLARRLQRAGQLSDAACWDYYGRDAHVAVGAEARYLRALTGRLVPLLLRYRPCRSPAATALLRQLLADVVLRPLIDLVSDPDTVNQLLLLMLDEAEPPEPAPQPPPPDVQLLSDWVAGGRPQSGSALAVDLSAALKSADLLYTLMQCVKERGQLPLIQFCLAVEEFNQRLLRPELTERQLVRLHEDAVRIYNSYLRPGAAEPVGVGGAACEQVRRVLADGVSAVVQLRRVAGLFQAYEHVYSHLERDCMVDFVTSAGYLAQLCGRQSAAAAQGRGAGGGRVLRSVTAVARWGRRLRHVLRPAVADGRLDDEPPELAAEPAELLAEDDDDDDEDSELNGEASAAGDLSSWRVSVPSVSAQLDALTGRQALQFVVEVRRPEPAGTQWRLCRQLAEFYALESRLRQFHGDLGDVRLPPRQSLVSASCYTQDFLDARRAVFAAFLSRLLLRPALAGSQLVHAFLTEPHVLAEVPAPDAAIGRFIRTVPRKFRKERGQSLDAFLTAFVASTDAAPGVQRRVAAGRDWSEPPESILAAAGCREPASGGGCARRLHTVARPAQQCRPHGPYDTLAFLACRLLEAPRWLLAAVLGARPLLRAAVDRLALDALRRALAVSLGAPAGWQRALVAAEQALLEAPRPPRTDQQKGARAELTQRRLRRAAPAPLALLLGARLDTALRNLLSCLQLPQLNKQLAYLLLDQIVVELFPELGESGDTGASLVTPTPVMVT